MKVGRADNPGWYGETPGWARGRGYWDGHYKHAPPPAVHYGYGPPVIVERWYSPPPPYMVYDKDYVKEQRKAQQEWRKELRERDKEARERWRDWYKD